MKSLILKKIAILSLSIIIFVIVAEIIARIYLNNHILYDIEMTRYSNLVKIDSPNPLIGHIHKPNISLKLMSVQVKINSDGFRDYEHSIDKKNKYRIIFLGDSLTFGWGVEQKQTFKNILEQEMNKKYPTEIINFGTGNYNTEQEVNFFLEKGLKYKSDKVVVFYFINDAEPTPKKSKLLFLGRSYLFTYYWSKLSIILTNLSYAKNYKNYYVDLYKENQVGWQNTQKAFLKLKQVCQDNNIALQVVILPDLHQLKDYPFQKENSMLISFLNKNGISSLDLTPYFTDYDKPDKLWVAKDDAHLNVTAHKLIALYSLGYLSERNNSGN